MTTTRIAGFNPKADQPYLVFLPDLGGWHVGEFITGDQPRWVLVSDASVEVWPTHVSDLPPDPVDEQKANHDHNGSSQDGQRSNEASLG